MNPSAGTESSTLSVIDRPSASPEDLTECKICSLYSLGTLQNRETQAQQAPHRRVDKVADARQEEAGNERLRHEQKHAAEDRQEHRRITHLVRAEIPETIAVFGIEYATSLSPRPKPEDHPPPCL